MSAPILEVKNLSKRFGGFVALDDISLSVPQGERLGLIGPNGSGKSTLVNCICGTLQNESGSVHFDGKPVDGLRGAPAHAARTFAQLPVAAAVHQPERRRQYPRAAALHRGARAAATMCRPPSSMRAATNCSSWWRSTPRPRTSPAI